MEQHVDHLRKVLECLRKNNLFAKPSKCMFAQSEFEFCGFLVSKNGIRTQPEKISLIKECVVNKDMDYCLLRLALW